MNNIKIIDADDWIGLYLNNKIEYQSHKLGLRNFVNYCTINNVDIKNVSFYGLTDEGQSWLENNINLPRLFSDISIEYLIRK